LKVLCFVFIFILTSCHAQKVDTNFQTKDKKENSFIEINLNNPCSKIIYKQVLRKYKNVLKQKKKSKNSYTFSLSAFGPSFSFTFSPYLDEKEVLELKLKISEDIEKYSKNLEDYLVNLRKYQFLKNFYNWEKARIEAGVDKIKENYADIRDYENIYSKVKVMEIKYEIFGIDKDELYKCYSHTYKNEVTNPFKLIKKDKEK